MAQTQSRPVLRVLGPSMAAFPLEAARVGAEEGYVGSREPLCDLPPPPQASRDGWEGLWCRAGSGEQSPCGVCNFLEEKTY